MKPAMLAGILALTGGVLQGQDVVPKGTAEFRWTFVNVLVVPDTTAGVEVVFVVTPGALLDEDSLPYLYYRHTFQPDDAVAWATSAESLLTSGAIDKSSRPVTLVGRDSSILMVAWESSERVHRKTSLISYPRPNPKEEKPLDVRLDSADAVAFLDSVRVKSGLSRVSPHAPPPDPTVVPADAVGEKPSVISFPSLEYPESLREAAVQGTVVVQAIVDTSGDVEVPTLKVLSSSDPQFSDAALKAVRRTQFRPGRINGRPVRVLVQLPFRFTLTHHGA